MDYCNLWFLIERERNIYLELYCYKEYMLYNDIMI